jgi:RNA recognition motif-containing protein
MLLLLLLLVLLLLLLLLLQAVLREAAGRKWVDPTLSEWPEHDFRIFVGDLGNEVNDDALAKAFQRYPSFAKAKVRSNRLDASGC